jgi:tetratricopeptide (TPR) repeat protein
MPFVNKSEEADKKSSANPAPTKNLFVGRTQELEFFEQAILSPTRPEFNIISISGNGGIGKSTLLKRFRTLAESSDKFREKCLTALVNEDTGTPSNVMKHFAEQLRQAGHQTPEFSKALEEYEESLRRLRAEREAGGEDFLRKAVDMFGSASESFVPIPAVGGFAKDGAKSLVEYGLERHRVKQAIKDAEKLKDPLGNLTKAWLKDLDKLAETRHTKTPLCLLFFFDTFEKLRLEIETWLLDLLLNHEVSSNVVLIIAGRDPVYKATEYSSKWYECRDSIKHLPLNLFSLEETRAYLAQYDISDESKIKRIYDQSNGLPFFLDLIVATTGDLTSATHDVIERFLRWIPKEQAYKRRLASEVALFSKPFKQDDLAAFYYLPQAELNTLYEWLCEQPFVRAIEGMDGGYRYHDLAQELFIRELYQRSPQDYYQARRALETYYQKQQTELEQQGGKEVFKSRLWIDLAKAHVEQLLLLPEEINHVKGLEQALLLDQHLEEKSELVGLLQQIAQAANSKLPLPAGIASLLTHLLNYLTVGLGEVEPDALGYIISKANKLENFSKNHLVRLFVSKGVAYLLREQHEQAILDFDKAIELDPKFAVAYARRGATYQLQEQHQQAIPDFDKVILLDPKLDWAYARRGQVYDEQKQDEQAIADFDKAILLDPKLDWAYARRGQVYLNLRNVEAAKSNLAEASTLDPSDVWYKLCLIWLEWLDLAPTQIIEKLEQVIVISQDENENVLVCKGIILWLRLQSSYDQALALLDRALALEPDDWAALFWKAVLKADRGHNQEAVDLLKQALLKGLPPIMLQPLKALKDNPEFYATYVAPLIP